MRALLPIILLAGCLSPPVPDEPRPPEPWTWTDCTIAVLLNQDQLENLDALLPDGWHATPYQAGMGLYELYVQACAEGSVAMSAIMVEAPPFAGKWADDTHYYALETWSPDPASLAVHGWASRSASLSVTPGMTLAGDIENVATFEGLGQASSTSAEGAIVYWQANQGTTAWAASWDETVAFNFGATTSCASSTFPGSQYVQAPCAGQQFVEVLAPSMRFDVRPV